MEPHRPNLINLNPVFLQKAHIHIVPEKVSFFWSSYLLFWSSKLAIFDRLGQMSELRSKCQKWGEDRKSSKQWSLTIKLIVLLMLRCCSSNWTFALQFWQHDVISNAIITSSDLKSKCWIWGAAQQFEQYNNVDGHWSLFTGFHYNFLSSPHFWHLLLNSDIGPPDEKNVAFEGVKPPQKTAKFFLRLLDTYKKYIL